MVKFDLCNGFYNVYMYLPYLQDNQGLIWSYTSAPDK